MKKLPRTDVIEKQVVVTLQEQRPGQEITAEDLDAVQGGLAIRPMYGVPLPFPKPGDNKWPSPWPKLPTPTIPGPRIPWPKPWKI